MAAGNRLTDACLTLISNGADVNAEAGGGEIPLIWAANSGLTGVCLALFDKGADVNAINADGNTPLSVAARNGHRETCITLLKRILLEQLLSADSEGGNMAIRKMRMRCAILTLRRTTIHKNLIALVIKSKPLIYDYTTCMYDTYCCRPRLNEYYHSITKDQLSDLLGQSNIDALKAAMQQACNACDVTQTVLKNLLKSK